MVDQDGARLVVDNQSVKRPTRSDLVYLEASPDYCLHKPDTGERRGSLMGGEVNSTLPVSQNTQVNLRRHLLLRYCCCSKVVS